MTPHQLLIVAIRLLAVFWLLSVLAQVPTLIVTFEHAEMEPDATIMGLSILFAISAVLWLFPSMFAGVLLRSGKTPASAPDAPLGEWYDLCFVAVGIFVLARGLPDLAYWVIVFASDGDALAEPLTLEQKANFAAKGVEIVVGAALVLGAKGLSTLVHRLRRAGVPVNQ